MKNLLARILCSAASSMWAKDPGLGAYSSETEQHELNLAFHYACELRNWLPWLKCDFDVSKRIFRQTDGTFEKEKHKRPDIIFHRRKIQALNLLVVELKRKKTSPAAKEDLRRIRYHWMEAPYRYRFGASVIMADAKMDFIVRLLSRDQREEEPVTLTSSTMGKPLHPPNHSADGLKALVERSAAAEKRNPNADTATAEREIDRQVYALYGLPPEQIQIVEDDAAP
jgi:hypothetical protein